MVVRCVPIVKFEQLLGVGAFRGVYTGCWRIQGGVYWVLAHLGGCILGGGAFRGCILGVGAFRGVYTGCWCIQGGVYWVLAHSGGAGILGGAFRGVYWVLAHSGGCISGDGTFRVCINVYTLFFNRPEKLQHSVSIIFLQILA